MSILTLFVILSRISTFSMLSMKVKKKTTGDILKRKEDMKKWELFTEINWKTNFKKDKNYKIKKEKWYYNKNKSKENMEDHLMNWKKMRDCVIWDKWRNINQIWIRFNQRSTFLRINLLLIIRRFSCLLSSTIPW